MVEIKSFSVIDGQADGDKVAAAVIQSAVYVLALRDLLAEFGSGAEAVSDTVVLVCPENFSNKPTAALLDVRRQLTVLRRQLSRLAGIESLLEALPAGLTFTLDVDSRGVPGRSPDSVGDSVRMVDARYAPDCLARCELCYFCRAESRGRTESLGREVRDELGAIDDIAVVLGLADGSLTPADDQLEAAELLRTAARLRRESLGGAA